MPLAAGPRAAAGYDPPFRLMGRHNEVWVVAEEETGAQTS